MLLGLLFFASSGLEAAPIYRWISPRGVVNYGGHPPARGSRITVLRASNSTLPVPPRAVLSRPPITPSSSRSTGQRRNQQQTQRLIMRLNLLSALQNQRNRSVGRKRPPHRAFALPYSVRRRAGMAP
ncbi:DUF4124 domain-containing protein [Acidithiobacillus sp.]|uniref:DUF4124 domain-containing protein n=1 Tax=Acidithiobacillus sp. TaxID=1872118 RepID=UPI0034466465